MQDGELCMSLYNGQPIVYTKINNPSFPNLLDFDWNFSTTLCPSDVCINFPIAEIAYNGDLLESFSNFMGDDEASYEMYGHLFAKRVLVVDYLSMILNQLLQHKLILLNLS